MSEGGRWFRVNTTWSQSEWLAALEPAARLAWIELLGYVKAHGYDGRAKMVTRNVVTRMFNIPAEDVGAMLEAGLADGAIVVEGEDWIITGWGEHQGDATAAERVRKYRQRHKGPEDVTRNGRNVTVLTATETKTETKTEQQPREPAGMLTMDLETQITSIVIACNRGMGDNPYIRSAYEPIVPSNGRSRQAAAELLAEGIPYETISYAVYEGAKVYRPSETRRQITSLKYFLAAVREEHARRTAEAFTPPLGPAIVPNAAPDVLARLQTDHPLEFAAAVDELHRYSWWDDQTEQQKVDTIRQVVNERLEAKSLAVK